MRVARDTSVHLTPDGDLVPGDGNGAPSLWPFTQSRRLRWRSTSPKRLDPVNLYVLRTPPDTVLAALRVHGWQRPDDGATHRTWINGAFQLMVDHIARGERSERTHARVFTFAGGTLVAAHHEVAPTGGPHVVTSWDRARHDVAEALTATGYERIAPTGIITPPGLRGVPSDGRAWRLIGPATAGGGGT